MSKDTLAPEWLGLDKVSELTGISRRSLDSRIDLAKIPCYRDPRDYRRRLIHENDVPKLLIPQPVVCGGDAPEEGAR